MYWAVKEDVAVLVSTWDTDGKPICILIKENKVVNEFERYFESTWDKIPQSNRDKKWVIKKLHSKIRRLEKMLE